MMTVFSKKSIAVLLAFILTGLGAVFAGDGQAVNKLGGNFSLTDHDNQPFELSQLKGSVVLMFFGFAEVGSIGLGGG